MNRKQEHNYTPNEKKSNNLMKYTAHIKIEKYTDIKNVLKKAKPLHEFRELN